MTLRFTPKISDDATVLCLGAHCDDIEIGCGGTLIELAHRHPAARFAWVVFSGDSVRERETRAAAAVLLARAEVSIAIHRFRMSYFPHVGAELKDTFEVLREQVQPELILTHHLADRHQDHRTIAELTWNTFRNHAILEYEIPKYEGDLAQPQVYCPLSSAAVESKIGALMTCFASQSGHSWFDADLFRGHLRLRGVEFNAPSRYAEAFHGRKILI